MTSHSDDLEEQLRQNLELRRLLGAEVARAQDSGHHQSNERPLRSAEVAKAQDSGPYWRGERPFLLTEVAEVEDSGSYDSNERPLRSAEVAKAQDSGPYWRGEKPLLLTEVAEAAPGKVDLEALRGELRLRRLVAAEAAEAQDTNAPQSGASWRGGVRAPDARPDNRNELGALRRELKRRRELGAEVAEAEALKRPLRTAYGFGQALYLACLALGLTWMAGYSFLVINSPTGSSQLLTPAGVAVIIVPALLLSGIGRDLRYLLSGE